MIGKIRNSRISKVIASYLAIQMIIQVAQPVQLWALTSGPSQPEFNSFTPIGTSDMVSLSSGGFNYNIPVMDVGGYPLNLAYDAGIGMDQESSWVGLGWNLNVGQINRQVRGIPDDFKGDEMTYETNLKSNVTVGADYMIETQIVGVEFADGVDANISFGSGYGIKYNNYEGISISRSSGTSFELSNALSFGMDTSISATEGVTIKPNVGVSFLLGKLKKGAINGSLNAGISYNSNRGLSDFSISGSMSYSHKAYSKFNSIGELAKLIDNGDQLSASGSVGSTSGSGSISFNNMTMTPRKRNAFTNNNGTVSVSLGGDIFATNALEVEFTGMGTVQKIRYPENREKAYGYEYTGHATPNDVLDYNRENDRDISETTMVLPVSNYTYDLYTVQGQGTGGMFRPFRSQIGQINDNLVVDGSDSFTFGAEIAPGAGFHYGSNFVDAPSTSRTGLWKNNSLRYFKQNKEDVKESDDAMDYEPVYFKYIGEPRIDQDQEMFDQLGGYSPIALEITGRDKSFNKNVGNRYRVKNYGNNGSPLHTFLPSFTSKFKKQRDKRNQNVQKLSIKETLDFYKDKNYVYSRINKDAPLHHTAEIRVQQADGSTYLYGETAYNNTKKEVTFATNSSDYNCASGLVRYLNNENTRGNKSGIDNFFDGVTTPKYAHTYLLSSIFSSDYEDIHGDGPTDDDLGAYTNFIYKNPNGKDYNWRVPYQQNMASYNAGLNSAENDQKGSYVYGEKELKYIDKIITKTHVAIFDISPRKDAKGVSGENGGLDVDQSMYKIDAIRLYSKPEAIKARILDDDDTNDLPITTIKTAFFEYDYSLCKNVLNNSGEAPSANELANQGGKLTLKKVYFTYRDSQMGKYTPYEFNYDGFNPNYNLKSYDVWGNYKPVVEDAIQHDANGNVIFDENEEGIKIPRINENYEGGSKGYCATLDDITAPEFAFVQQENRELQDAFASAWSLTSIELPSGGKVEITYESDDYQYVQNKATMQMFKVVGSGEEEAPNNPEGNQKFYKSGPANVFDGDTDYLYVKLPEDNRISNEEFKRKYLNGIQNKPIYFRFLMNMNKIAALSTSSSKYDYVTGYFNISSNKRVNVFEANNAVYAAIPMKFTDMEGGIAGTKKVNPISKAGWYFGRRYLNRLVYGLNQDYKTENLETIVRKILATQINIDLLTGPNGKLRSNRFLCAQRFNPEKSWIRLTAPKPNKLGGGLRVKKLVMQDQWGKMVDENIADNNKKYNKEYGQEYSYVLDDGTTSGVATYEPNNSQENPFVEPFYNKSERLIAPREVNYVEKPFGSSFFPSPTITYSKVEVKNLRREGITKHATGSVITEYFTSKNFPTRVDHTNLDHNYVNNEASFLENILTSLVGGKLKVDYEYALSQGFMIHTNDMNGKMSYQKVYAEGQNKETDAPISTVQYKYNTEIGDESTLNNRVPIISKDGTITGSQQIGVDYDVVNDFRESYSNSRTMGASGNVIALPVVPPVVIGSVIPSASSITRVAHSAITTKVIHTTAILKEKIATDLGATVSTENVAWDGETGQVLLTKTVNEFDDQYYNFNFPAYWAYENMGHASKNIGITGKLKNSGDYFTMPDADKYFTLGDEILATYGFITNKLWVVGFNSTGNGVLLMNSSGGIVNRSEGVSISADLNFKIVRSGHRNQQMASMASITMMDNPILDAGGNFLPKIDSDTFTLDANTSLADNQKIISASAVEYKDYWNCQCENKLPFVAQDIDVDTVLEDISQENYPLYPVQFNPYLYNAKGEWRAKKSYAYLTERTDVKAENGSNRINTRKEGYFKDFVPYYELVDGEWQKSSNANDAWTFASEVTQYSPYGIELENKDALNRYSAAQYGYNYTLPVAVASNSEYSDMGSDGFEDYSYLNIPADEGHFNFKGAADQDGEGGITVSNDVAHTGRTSLNVPANNSADMEVNLQGELPPDTDYDNDIILNANDKCPYTDDPNNLDYDDDGIGDFCDDDPLPQIVEVQELEGIYRFDYRNDSNNNNGEYEYCNGRRVRFVIQGNPNATVPYMVKIAHFEERGFSGLVNQKLVVSRNKGNVDFESTDESHIKLDITGRAEIFLDLGLRNRGSGKRDNAAFILFQIINKQHAADSNSEDDYVLNNYSVNMKQQVGLYWKSKYKKCHGGNSNKWKNVSPEGNAGWLIK